MKKEEEERGEKEEKEEKKEKERTFYNKIKFKQFYVPIQLYRRY